MAKSGFGKFLAICTVAAAAAVGVYYYLNKQDEDFADDLDDDFDDFDDFDEEDTPDSRNYVDLERDASLDKEDDDEDADDVDDVDEATEDAPEDDDTFHVKDAD